MPTYRARLRFAPPANHKLLTPERRAVERIKRRATAMAIAAIAEGSAEVVLGAGQEPAPASVQAPLARKCRCPDAEVKAYREGADWICHTCGYELPICASHRLSARGSTRDSIQTKKQMITTRPMSAPASAPDATQVQLRMA